MASETYADVKSKSLTAGPYSGQVTFANPTGNMYITAGRAPTSRNTEEEGAHRLDSPEKQVVEMIFGETVTVIRPSVALDELGEPVEGEPERETVENVLVAPGATTDMDETRPQGRERRVHAAFPERIREVASRLLGRGARNRLRGRGRPAALHRGKRAGSMVHASRGDTA